MKNLLLLILPCCMMLSCKNVDQYRAPIESLTSEWAKAGEAVMATGSSIGTASTFLNSMVDSFKIDSTKKWSKNAMMSMDSMKQAFMAQVQGISGLISEVSDFRAKWMTMSADVEALNSGLKNGKLEGDVMAKINDLKSNCAMAMTQSEAWNKNVMGAQTTAVTAYDKFKTAMKMK
ncbi:MAG: hypothetical protein ABI851_09695 [Saprospiraceae bacterium]